MNTHNGDIIISLGTANTITIISTAATRISTPLLLILLLLLLQQILLLLQL